ncbi:MAG TPA: hypothetical protein VNF03_19860 [Patescibacteria group bacterium]|jgi:hypothetical protein|nr:hypothetical protein [Patescibacteria group bacterium]
MIGFHHYSGPGTLERWCDVDGRNTPGNGDTAVLNHAVTVDDTRIVGTSPAAGPGTDAIRCNAALTITATGNLTVRGDRAQQRAAELVYRRYHKFIPKLRGRDGAHAARWLAAEGL